MNVRLKITLLLSTVAVGALACSILFGSIDSFTATPTILNPGETTTLEWKTYMMDRCWLSDRINDSLISTISAKTKDTISVTVDDETLFSLYCKGTDGEAYATVTVAVREPAAKVVYFIATPAAISSGITSLLSWRTTGATSCTVTPGDLDVKAGESSLAVTPAETTTYALTCQDALGGTPPEAASQLTVTVNP